MTIKTDPLPETLPNINVVVSKPEKMEPGMTMANQANTSYHFIYDANGETRWYYNKDSSHVFTRLKNGNFLITDDEIHPKGNIANRMRLQEISPLGRMVASYYIPDAIHHDAIELNNGNFLITTKNDDHYVEDVLMEIDRNTGKTVNTINMRDILPSSLYPQDHPDWCHINAVWYDESDGSILVSCRHLSMTFKLDYPSGKIIWILSSGDGIPENLKEKLLTPVDSGFKFPVSQHAVMKLPETNQDEDTIEILLFDNNEVRLYGKQPEDSEYSQGLHLRINEKEKTAEEVWSYGKELGKEWLSKSGSDFNYYPTQKKYFISFSDLANKKDAKSAVFEIDAETKEIIFYATFHNAYTYVYRSERENLYPNQWTPLLSKEKIKIYGEQRPVFSVSQQNNSSIGKENYTITIHKITKVPFLESNQTITLYDGSKEIVHYKNEPTKGTQYVIADITIENMSGNGTEIDLGSLSLPLKEKEYKRIDDGFLSNHGYYRLPSYGLRYGSKSGFICLEVPESLILDTALSSPDKKEETDKSDYTAIEETQNQLELEYLKFYESTAYPLDNPYIVQDLYNLSPLTALVQFQTPEETAITITIKGKNSDTDLMHTFTEFTKEHKIPIYGLYADYENTYRTNGNRPKWKGKEKGN